MQKEAVSLFISYAHDDDDYVRVFKEGLEQRLKRSSKYVWHIWTDHQISPGDLWHESIQRAAKKCDCALLLVSTGFMASEYIENEELGRFLERHEQKDNLLIVPVMLVPCAFHEHPELKKRQLFFPNGKDFGKHEFENLTFADLVDFDLKRQPQKNPNRERFLNTLVNTLENAMLKKRPLPAPTSAGIIATPLFDPALSRRYPDIETRMLDRMLPPPSDVDTVARGYVEMRYQATELGPRTREEELARTYETGNKLTELIFRETERIHEKIMDSAHLKAQYVHVHFDDIVFRDALGPQTQQMIMRKRRHHGEFPWFERNLIVSALTLRLLHRFDTEIAYELIDFVRDKEPRVWKKALTGLVVAVLEHENTVNQPENKHLRRDIALLQNDREVQDALLEVEKNIAGRIFEEGIEEQKTRLRFDEKFEFFAKPQHWFLPFYEDNPVLEEHISDPELRRLLIVNFEWEPDALKYAFCQQYKSLDQEERAQFLAPLRKTDRQIREEYALIQSQYPEQEPAEAIRNDREVLCCLKELYFFSRYFPDERFRKVFKEKRSLYHGTLADLLHNELVRLKITALGLYFAEEDEQAIPYF